MANDSVGELEERCTPPDMREDANVASNGLLPKLSRELYEKEYKKYIEWCTEKGCKTSQNVLLIYLTKLAEKYAPTSLYTKYSCLKAMIKMTEGIDITSFSKLQLFLSRQAEGYVPKQARPLTDDQIKTFLNTASDKEYLDVKVITVFGLMGALRTGELVNIEMKDIQDMGTIYFVKIPVTKTKKPKTFTIHDEYYQLVKKYFSLRPNKLTHDRAFLNYQDEKCTRQPIGKTKIANLPKKIAKFLELPEPETYTGHSYRRSSASLAANAGADITTLKRLGGWKSDKVVDTYVEQSLNSKKRIAELINTNISNKKKPVPSTSKNDNCSSTITMPMPSTSKNDNRSSTITMPMPSTTTKFNRFRFKTPTFNHSVQPSVNSTDTDTIETVQPSVNSTDIDTIEVESQDTSLEQIQIEDTAIHFSTCTNLSQYIIEDFVSQSQTFQNDEESSSLDISGEYVIQPLNRNPHPCIAKDSETVRKENPSFLLPNNFTFNNCNVTINLPHT